MCVYTYVALALNNFIFDTCRAAKRSGAQEGCEVKWYEKLHCNCAPVQLANGYFVLFLLLCRGCWRLLTNCRSELSFIATFLHSGCSCGCFCLLPLLSPIIKLQYTFLKFFRTLKSVCGGKYFHDVRKVNAISDNI